MQINPEDRKKLVWLLKRATSVTAWQRFSDACDAFAKAFEYSLKNAKPEPLLRAPDNGKPDVEGYKAVLDAQINFAKGLAMLRTGDRSVFRYGHELDCAGDLRSRFQRVFGPNPDQIGDYVNFDEMDALFLIYVRCDPSTSRHPEYSDLRIAPLAPLIKLQNFPLNLPEVAEPNSDIIIKTGEVVPLFGIWEPVKLLSGPKPAIGGKPFSLLNRWAGTAPPGAAVKYDLEIIAAPAYLMKGDKAGGAQTDENVPANLRKWEGEPVTWRLLWADDRYTDGSIPPEEADYFANLDASASPQQTDAAVRLRCEAGQPCPREGFWMTPAQANSRQHFKQGEYMPALGSGYGTTIWQWDENQSS